MSLPETFENIGRSQTQQISSLVREAILLLQGGETGNGQPGTHKQESSRLPGIEITGLNNNRANSVSRDLSSNAQGDQTPRHVQRTARTAEEQRQSDRTSRTSDTPNAISDVSQQDIQTILKLLQQLLTRFAATQPRPEARPAASQAESGPQSSSSRPELRTARSRQEARPGGPTPDQGESRPHRPRTNQPAGDLSGPNPNGTSSSRHESSNRNENQQGDRPQVPRTEQTVASGPIVRTESVQASDSSSSRPERPRRDADGFNEVTQEDLSAAGHRIGYDSNGNIVAYQDLADPTSQGPFRLDYQSNPANPAQPELTCIQTPSGAQYARIPDGDGEFWAPVGNNGYLDLANAFHVGQLTVSSENGICGGTQEARARMGLPPDTARSDAAGTPGTVSDTASGTIPGTAAGAAAIAAAIAAAHGFANPSHPQQ